MSSYRKCSLCQLTGHNSATCSLNSSRGEKRPKAPRASGGPRRCSYCFQTNGHNKSTCPTKIKDDRWKWTRNSVILGRRSMAEFCKRTGFGIGSAIRLNPKAEYYEESKDAYTGTVLITGINPISVGFHDSISSDSLRYVHFAGPEASKTATGNVKYALSNLLRLPSYDAMRKTCTGEENSRGLNTYTSFNELRHTVNEITTAKTLILPPEFFNEEWINLEGEHGKEAKAFFMERY